MRYGDAMKIQRSFLSQSKKAWLSYLVLVVIQLGFTLLFYRNLPLMGDELTYYTGAQKLIQGDLSGLYGQHFMPGISILLYGGEGIKTIFPWLDFRTFISLTSLIFAGITIILIPKNWGQARCIYPLFLALSPMIIFFSTRIWSDLIAGHILVIICLLTYRSVVKNPHSFRSLVVVGGLCATLLYFRNNLLLLGPAIFLVLACNNFIQSKLFKHVLRNSFKNGAALMIGFSLIWLPWVIASSMKTNEFTLHPGLIKRTQQTKIWAISPPSSEWGSERGTDFSHRLFVHAEGILVQNNLIDPNQVIGSKVIISGPFKRDSTGALFAGRRLGYNRLSTDKDIWKLAVDQAEAEILKDIRGHLTLKTRLSAYRRNFMNLFANPNHFLAAGLKNANVEFHESNGVWQVKRPYTVGGAAIDANIWPTHKFASLYLIFNAVYYVFLLASAVLFSLGISQRGSSRLFAQLATGAIASFLILIFMHPGHGRYIFQLMPLLVLCASLFWSSRLKTKALS